jgi:16S rRNA (cytidine1402-2'-O)-methyltransferase
MKSNKVGSLYVVATPIGNLQDMTLRAIEILKKVDRIIAEDTRHIIPLLTHYAIQKPLFSLHEFNERERIPSILNAIEEGENMALVSDAGTPLVSDPGFPLIREAKLRGLPVVPVPGACAAITALSAAGLPTNRFTFEGFLPAKSEARRQSLLALRHEARTMIFYEAPHRLLATLQDLADVFGPAHPAVVAREMTKIHESILSLSLNDLMHYFLSHPQSLRGEIVILLEGVDVKKQATKEVVPETVLDILLQALPVKQAVSLTSQITHERKNKLYEMALEKKK